MYREFVLPCHRRILDELTVPGADRSMHLCGDAQRFFPILQKELGVMSFDTGFPVDFARLYDELLPGTRIYGGPSTGLLLNGTPERIDAEVRRILASGVMGKSRAFVLREGNSLAPGTPFANVNQILLTSRDAGVYPRTTT
jgi:uroporphyrinogen-III decarboxylase